MYKISLFLNCHNKYPLYNAYDLRTSKILIKNNTCSIMDFRILDHGISLYTLESLPENWSTKLWFAWNDFGNHQIMADFPISWPQLKCDPLPCPAPISISLTLFSISPNQPFLHSLVSSASSLGDSHCWYIRTQAGDHQGLPEAFTPYSKATPEVCLTWGSISFYTERTTEAEVTFFMAEPLPPWPQDNSTTCWLRMQEA
jgi:hypothetical protein